MVTKADEGELRARLGAELRKARTAKRLTQAELAEKVETDSETISRFERGSTLPSLTRLLTLADALGVTVAALLGAASPREADELDALRRALDAMDPKERRLAKAVLRAMVEGE